MKIKNITHAEATSIACRNNMGSLQKDFFVRFDFGIDVTVEPFEPGDHEWGTLTHEKVIDKLVAFLMSDDFKKIMSEIVQE